MRYLYFPGCSQEATGKPGGEAIRAVLPRLGVELSDIPDWSCCGASLAIGVNKVVALSLGARNLALGAAAGQAPREIVTPCPACNLALNKAGHVLESPAPEEAALSGKVGEALQAGGYRYDGGLRARHLLDVLVNDVGVERIRKEAVKPLSGLKIAAWYGCQIVRPYADGDDAEDPDNLEQLVEACGASAARFALRTACCGGALVATSPELGARMTADIIRSAANAGADAITTPCPMCQVTVEMAMKSVRPKAPLPVLSPVQLVGLAMGLADAELGLGRALVPATCLRRPLLPAARTDGKAA